MKNNKGYTLIEAIIVIAIMAILAGMAFVTLNVVHQAKYNAAINTFENELSSLWIKTKALSQGKKLDNAKDVDELIGTGEAGKYPLCMLIAKTSDGSYEMKLGYDDGTSDFKTKEVVSTLTNLISIRYVPSKDDVDQQVHDNLTLDESGATIGANGAEIKQVLIQFNKSNGSVECGAGSYEILFNDNVVGTVYLDRITGNHYVK